MAAAVARFLAREGEGDWCHFFMRQWALKANAWHLRIREEVILLSGSSKAITREELEFVVKRWGGQTQEGNCMTFSDWKEGLLAINSYRQSAGECAVGFSSVTPVGTPLMRTLPQRTLRQE